MDVQVFLDGGDGLSAQVDEGAVRGPLAQGLDADAAAAGEEIEQAHAGDARAQNVEEGRLDAVEDRPRSLSRHDEQCLSSR